MRTPIQSIPLDIPTLLRLQHPPRKPQRGRKRNPKFLKQINFIPYWLSLIVKINKKGHKNPLYKHCTFLLSIQKKPFSLLHDFVGGTRTNMKPLVKRPTLFLKLEIYPKIYYAVTKPYNIRSRQYPTTKHTLFKALFSALAAAVKIERNSFFTINRTKCVCNVHRVP